MGTSIEEKGLITDFVTALMKEAKLDHLPEGYDVEYRRRLSGQVMERLGLAALAALPKSDAPRAQELGEREAHEELMQLFQKSIPQFPELVAKTLAEFRQNFLDGIAAGRKTAGSP